MTLEIDILALFPAMLEGPLSESIPGRIREQGLAEIRIHELRRWGLGRHRSLDQAHAADLAARSHLILVCPRYEGVDDRIRSLVDLELSIGDYVLTGGELAALVVVDAVIRLLPGAIDAESTQEESFAHGLLEYPQYTRPAEFRGETVPAVLAGGDHEAV